MINDIRLCNKSGVSDLRFITEILSVNPYCPYNFFHQSKSNSRGVGILIKKSLNFSCTGEERDQLTDNYLLLRADINSSTVILGSIYGPNENNPNFYVSLKNSIQRLGGHPCILGGDWNATQSCLPLASNIDVLNMQALPSIANSKKIKEMCLELGLSDPFRVLFPNKLDYSYAPWGNTRNNRSRLDFFVISNNIIPLVTDCWIKPSVQSRLFDHKAVFLDFTVTKPMSSRPNITNRILNDPDIDKVVELSSLECYSIYLEGNDEVRNEALRLVGMGFDTIKEAGPDPAYLPYAHADLRDLDERTQLVDRLNVTMAELRDLDLENFPLTIQDDIFMEMLINGIKNAVISYQSHISKIMSQSREKLQKK
jgi:exonuclease III